MTRSSLLVRLRPALAGAAAVLLSGTAAELRAQDTIPAVADTVTIPIPPEAVRADTLPDRVVTDSAAAAADTVPPDSTLPAPNFPVFPEARTAGFSTAVWVFGPEELGRFHGLTLLELLDRIPGLVVTREGGAGRPAGIATLASGGGRVRIFMDGWEMRPLGSLSPDLQHVPLLDVQSVRVVRGLNETRIEVQTLRVADRRPYALVEGMEGDFNTRVLRGLFARPLGRRFNVQVGMDLVETAGFRRREDFNENTLFGRFSWLFGEDRGIQLDLRRTALDSERTLDGVGAGTLPRLSADRGEVILRARGRVAGGFWLDAAVGRSWEEPTAADSVTLARESLQGMVRAAVDVPFGSLVAAARLHRVDEEGFAADATELSARAELTPAPFVAAWGRVRAASVGGDAGVEAEAGARVGPFAGFSLFGAVAGGTRPLRFWRDSTEVVTTIGGAIDPSLPTLDTVPLVLFRGEDAAGGGFRAGAAWTRGTIAAGAAVVGHRVDAVAPFGFWFDRGRVPVDGGTVTGVEAYASFPVLWRQVRFDATYTDFLGSNPARPFLPARYGRAALEYHWVYRSGNLEPTLRAEVIGRDRTLTLNPETGAFDVYTEPYAVFNLFVQIRVLDVRAFWRMENVLNRDQAADIPGLTLPGVRATFGVRWFFRD